MTHTCTAPSIADCEIVPDRERGRSAAPEGEPITDARAAGGRDRAIETLRGLAVILMVLGHVIGNSHDRGLQVSDDSAYRHFYYSTEYLRMPLFTVISGFVYALRPMRRGQARSFLRGKGRRLLAPLVTVSLLQFTAQSLVSGVHETHAWSDVWRIFFFGYDQFWFLQALLGVFLTVAVIEQLQLASTCGRWLSCVAVALLMSHYLPMFELFSFWGYLFLLPYFLLGLGLHRFASVIARPAVTIAAAALVIAGSSLQEMEWRMGPLPPFEPTSWLASSVGIGGVVLLFRFRCSSSWLADLGTHSFPIYLFHVFATGGTRIVLSRCGIHGSFVHLIAGLAAGLLLPIATERILERSPLLSSLLLGAPSRDRKRSSRPSAAPLPYPAANAEPAPGQLAMKLG